MQPYADYEVNDGTEEAQEYFADIEKQLSALDAEMAALNKVGEKLISAPATYWRQRRRGGSPAPTALPPGHSPNHFRGQSAEALRHPPHEGV